ncbi:UDP-4-amino-4,6-dideoxy-N-acetyl-beta-L-altrosamine N-acetyltransferase [Rummeliibacillus pycnus]|uniref:UDP-4-amino-4, 6-dideoxy-N-acetyl-beta-L-altrosamine N-acetyltransferase n=1 Tax=Rummeliibacillus pycnus TaxID=101070 RepID=UPI000C9AF18C|nr:UDP-4-amino-4,6-dideoxy-N-acetyl-beta-L-altrosamine N-acetyltransferase [Rummeliibacillus pycnus]
MLNLRLCSLEDIKPRYVQLVLEWRNQKQIREMMFNSNIIQLDEHRKWIESLDQGDKIAKVFCYNGLPMGVIQFTYLNREANIGEWGFYIGNSQAPKGMGTLLGFTAINFLFNDLKLRKLCAEVLSFNKISLSFHQKLGFSKDGVLRQHVLKKGDFYDVHIFSMFKNEWENHKEQIKQQLEEK